MRPVDVCLSVTLTLASGGAFGADAQPGRLLYETHCGTCHYEKLHERKTSAISTIVALKVEVAKWAAQTNRRFTQAELDDIAEYLNQSHYRLAK
jgi:hypothetical protein